MSHTHDGIDWTTRLATLRRADEIEAEVKDGVAERLIDLATRDAAPGSAPVVVDVGSGAGGMSAAFARALAKRGGGTVVLADAVPELLTAAEAHVKETVAAGGVAVTVETALGDAATAEFIASLPAADLGWASGVVHHLPDQQKALTELAGVVAPGGWLALVEGGLATQCLPWDQGVGEPGLVSRLIAIRDSWFTRMRAEMDGVVRMPIGWNKALAAAGLAEVFSFSYLIDLPAPAAPAVRESVVEWLGWLADTVDEELDDADREAVRHLLDPEGPAYVGARDDVFVLGASTVHLGRRKAA